MRFDPAAGLIIVPTELTGPARTVVVHLALDTGATRTVVDARILTSLGYDLAHTAARMEVTTASGVEYAVQLIVSQVSAVGHTRSNLPVLAHTLPALAGVDGLLGLDFFRECCLTIDFRAGIITLE